MAGTIDNRKRTFLEPPQEVWRPIHYLGSKLRLTGLISEILDDLSGGPVCDLFAGSGTVSLALSRSRDVIAADIQEYSRVLCTALLKPAVTYDQDVIRLLARAEETRCHLESCLEPLLQYEDMAIESSGVKPELLCDLVDDGSLLDDKANGHLAKALHESKRRLESAEVPFMAVRYFGGRYFSFRQAAFIDSILNEHGGEIFTAALLSTASDIVNSIGKQFAQPMRPRRKDGSIKTHLVRQMCRDRDRDASEVFRQWLSRYRSIFQNRTHQVIRDDYRNVLAQQTSATVIYADPPYTRDHYSRFYHVLETLCLQDSPDVSATFSTGPTSRGAYRADRHQSPFCIKSKASIAFSQLFAGANGLPMLVSYSPFVANGHPRMMTIEAVTELAKRHYRSVTVVEASMVHSKLNKTDLHRSASDQAEVLIVCR